MIETAMAVVPTKGHHRTVRALRASTRWTAHTARPASTVAAATSTAPTWLGSGPLPTVSPTPSSRTTAQVPSATTVATTTTPALLHADASIIGPPSHSVRSQFLSTRLPREHGRDIRQLAGLS